ncbi:MAG: hypothetical protein V1707_02425, partial [bacterium]
MKKKIYRKQLKKFPRTLAVIVILTAILSVGFSNPAFAKERQRDVLGLNDATVAIDRFVFSLIKHVSDLTDRAYAKPLSMARSVAVGAGKTVNTITKVSADLGTAAVSTIGDLGTAAGQAVLGVGKDGTELLVAGTETISNLTSEMAKTSVAILPKILDQTTEPVVAAGLAMGQSTVAVVTDIASEVNKLSQTTGALAQNGAEKLSASIDFKTIWKTTQHQLTQTTQSVVNSVGMFSRSAVVKLDTISQQALNTINETAQLAKQKLRPVIQDPAVVENPVVKQEPQPAPVPDQPTDAQMPQTHAVPAPALASLAPIDQKPIVPVTPPQPSAQPTTKTKPPTTNQRGLTDEEYRQLLNALGQLTAQEQRLGDISGRLVVLENAPQARSVVTETRIITAPSVPSPLPAQSSFGNFSSLFVSGPAVITAPLFAKGASIGGELGVSGGLGVQGSSMFGQGPEAANRTGTTAKFYSTATFYETVAINNQSLTLSGSKGNLVVSGTAAIEGNLTLGSASRLSSDLIPATNSTYSLGSATNKFKELFVETLNVSGLSISGTSENGFVLDSDNTTADTEDIQLIFDRGTVSPNAIITWDATNDRFDFNQPVLLQSSLTVNGSTILASDAASTVAVGNTTGAVAVNGSIVGITGNSGDVTIGTATSGDVVLNPADGSTVELQKDTNVTGNVDVSGTLSAGTGNAFSVDSSGNISTTGTLDIDSTSTFGNTIALDGSNRIVQSTGGNLAVRTVTSGDLNITSAGAVAITGAGASTWDIGNNLLSIQTTNNGAITTGTGLLTVGGNLSVNGSTATIGSTAITLSGSSPVIDLASATTLSLNTTTNRPITTGTGLFTAGGAVTNTGLLTANGGITADSGVFTVADATGAVHTSSTLDVDSTSTFGDTIALDGSNRIIQSTSADLTVRTVTSGALSLTSAGALTITGAGASTWDIGNNLLSLQTTGNGAITTGTGLFTAGGDLKVVGNDIQDSGGTSALIFDGSANTQVNGNLTIAANKNLSLSSGTGQLTVNSAITNNSLAGAVKITPVYTGGGTDSLTYTAFQVDGFSPVNATGTDNVNAVLVGNLTDPGASITSTALNIGSGWDTVLSVNGTTVINSTGQVPVGQLTGTIFTITDSVTPQTIVSGDTLTFADGTDINVVTSATDTVTVNNTSTLATVTGRGATTTALVNLDGGIAVDTSNFTVSGTTGAVYTASTLDVDSTSTFGNKISLDGATRIIESDTGNLTIQTATSGTMALDSAGALNLGTTNSTSTSLGKAATTLTINPTSWTATPTISGAVTMTSGFDSNAASTASSLTLDANTGTALTISGTSFTTDI